MGVNAPPTFMWHDKTSGRLYASTAEVEFKEVQLKTGMKYRIRVIRGHARRCVRNRDFSIALLFLTGALL
jgi:hypothetical protein